MSSEPLFKATVHGLGHEATVQATVCTVHISPFPDVKATVHTTVHSDRAGHCSRAAFFSSANMTSGSVNQQETRRSGA